MLDKILNTVFGCGHHRTTFPQTPSRRAGFANAHGNATYVVCLDCGKEFDYNWNAMRIGAPVMVSQAARRPEFRVANR